MVTQSRDMFFMNMSFHVLAYGRWREDLNERGGKVTLRTVGKEFVDEAAQVAARRRVLLSLSESEEEKQAIHDMAREELESL